MMRQSKIIYFLCLSILLFPFKALGFDDKDTHPRFTQGAIKKSKFEEFATTYLGFTNGIVNSTLPYKNDPINSVRLNATVSDAYSTIYEWDWNGWPILELLKGGSSAEDTPDCRAANHFYNPEAAA